MHRVERTAECSSMFSHTIRVAWLELPSSNQIYLVPLRPTQLTQASFLQKNQMLQDVFLIFLTLR